jgi:hypothetical protein
MTPARPEMLMLMLMEEDLHLLKLRLAACELQTTTRHELNVCSLQGFCITQRVVKLRCREMVLHLMSYRFMVSQLATRKDCSNEKGFAKCG